MIDSRKKLKTDMVETTEKEIAKVLGLAPTSIGPLLVRAERELGKRY